MAKDASGTLRKVAPQTRPAADFAFSQLNTAVPMILSAAGFNGGSANACVLLGELVQRFLALLARTSAESAQAANRTEPTAWDVEMSLEHVMGFGALTELKEWADEEGVWKRDLSQLIPEPVLKQRARLAEYVSLGEKKSVSELHYLPISDGMRAELEVRRAIDEAEEDAWVWDETPPHADDVEAEEPLAETTTDTPSYIPPFLPAFPDLDALPGEEMHIEPEPAKEEAPGPAPMPRPPPVILPTAATELDQDGIRRIWRRRLPVYTGSLVEGAPPATSFPSLDAARNGPAPEKAQKRSSLDAFMHATEELAEESARPTPVYLTSLTHSHHVNPNSAAFIDGAVKRRRLAHCFVDPQRYEPNDSMHGCVDLHPASPAWVPGPSLLITIPSAQGNMEESAHAAPVFTPINPQGRVVATAPPSGALFPTMSYRFPAQLYNGVRVVAPAPLLRVFSRSGDPPAVLDDHHTERVFHGMAASRTLMTGTMMSVQHRHSLSVMINRYRGGNSILHPALERLRFSLAAQLAAQRRALHAEEAEQLEEEPIRGERIKMPIAGTLVHAWDWPTVLPWADAEERPATTQ